MRLLVVGAGIGGSMVARTAREEGWDVTVAAAGVLPAASAAALCVVRPEWFSGEQRRAARYAVVRYGSLGALTAAEATYTRYDRSGHSLRPGFFAVDPRAVLVEPDTELRWHPEDPPWGYDAVVACLGAHGPSPGDRWWGVTTIIHHEAAPGLWARLNRPRDLIFAANHSGATLRFGSSVANDERTAYERQVRMERRVGDFLPDGERTHISGVRLMPHGEPGVIRRIGRRTWTLDTFGRVGFSLAPQRAVDVLKEVSGCASSTSSANQESARPPR